MGHKLFSTLGLFVLFLAPGPFSRAASSNYVEVTTEIVVEDWDYRLFADRLPPGHRPHQSNLFPTPGTMRCVVGEKTWMIESHVVGLPTKYWFTGTNVVVYPVSPGEFTALHPSTDGNPARPVGAVDLFGFDLGARFAWLSFCSGPCLKQPAHKINPPSFFWKETSLVWSGWTDRMTNFDDTLGLPKSLTLVATNGQPVFEYQVSRATNILGWNFPLEFYALQYQPTGTNHWKLHATFKGRVTSIAPTTEPLIPASVMRVVRR